MAKDDITVLRLKERIAFHESEIKRLKDALSLVLEVLDPTGSGGIMNTQINRVNETNEEFVPTNATFEAIILGFLQSHSELGSRALMEAYMNVTGKRMDISQFSSRLGILIKKGVVKKKEYPERPMSERYTYMKA